MSRLQEVEKLLDSNLECVTAYSKRCAELLGSIRALEKEREKLMKKKRKNEVVHCQDCAKLNRYDCPLCYIERQTLIFAEVAPDFYCAAGTLKD